MISTATFPGKRGGCPFLGTDKKVGPGRTSASESECNQQIALCGAGNHPVPTSVIQGLSFKDAFLFLVVP